MRTFKSKSQSIFWTETLAYQRNYIAATYETLGFNESKVAKFLGISRGSLRKYLTSKEAEQYLYKVMPEKDSFPS